MPADFVLPKEIRRTNLLKTLERAVVEFLHVFIFQVITEVVIISGFVKV